MQHPWLRRPVTVGLYMAAWLLYLALLPAALPVALVVDVVRRTRLAMVRVVLFAGVYLLCEQVGVLASVALWLANGGPLGRPERPAYVRWHIVLQRWWSETLFRAIRGLLGLRLTVEGLEACRLGEGPTIIFIRHAGMVDTLLPSHFIANAQGVHMKFVLSDNLRWDPCLDIVGERLGNIFVRKGSGRAEQEVARIVATLDGLASDEGLLIYPEGMRLTAARRERVMEAMRRRGEVELLRRSEGLRRLMPPKLGGAMGLLANNARADIVFFAHAGLDDFQSVGKLLDGSMVGAEVRIKAWRLSRSEVPEDAEGQLDWFFQEWFAMDRWVDAQLGELNS